MQTDRRISTRIKMASYALGLFAGVLGTSWATAPSHNVTRQVGQYTVELTPDCELVAIDGQVFPQVGSPHSGHIDYENAEGTLAEVEFRTEGYCRVLVDKSSQTFNISDLK